MREMKMFGCWAIILALVGSCASIELTFELPDNANQCFYEEINKTTSSTLEFQVVTGGQYDVDVTIENPLGQVLYKEIRKQYDSHTWTAETDGVYQVCFSNEFSTFSHKIIYMDWQVGSDSNLPNRKPSSATAMTMIESSALSIHERLKVIDDYQTHNRLREATDRTSAEDLNDRVLWWSVGQSVIVMVLGISQVFVLRSFFSDRASRR